MSTDNPRRPGFTVSYDWLTQMVGPVESSVFSVIERHCMMKEGQCRASQRTLADLIGCSTRTVKRKIKKLKEREFITEIAHQAGGKVNLYVVNRTKFEEARAVFLSGRPESLTASDIDDFEGEKAERWDSESQVVGQRVLPGRTESPRWSDSESYKDTIKDTIKDRNKDIRCNKCIGQATLIASVCGLITVSS